MPGWTISHLYESSMLVWEWFGPISFASSLNISARRSGNKWKVMAIHQANSVCHLPTFKIDSKKQEIPKDNFLYYLSVLVQMQKYANQIGIDVNFYKNLWK